MRTRGQADNRTNAYARPIVGDTGTVLGLAMRAREPPR